MRVVTYLCREMFGSSDAASVKLQIVGIPFTSWHFKESVDTSDSRDYDNTS